MSEVYQHCRRQVSFGVGIGISPVSYTGTSPDKTADLDLAPLHLASLTSPPFLARSRAPMIAAHRRVFVWFHGVFRFAQAVLGWRTSSGRKAGGRAFSGLRVGFGWPVARHGASWGIPRKSTKTW
jgi:hypothetical protein